MRQAQKKTVANDHGREVRSFESRFKLKPLEFMLEVVNNDQLPMELRCAMAAESAPYLHAKLKAMDSDGVAGPAQPGLDLTKLSDEDLAQLDRIVTKYT